MRTKYDIRNRTRRIPPARRGFVLALAVLISSVLLSIGLSLFSITIKELILSSAGRESQFAFYAADTGGECALYWDIRHPGFSSSIFATSTGSQIPQGSGANCNNADITDPATGWDASSGWGTPMQSGTQVSTVFDMAFANGSCATVTVIKDSSDDSTRMDSRGFNTCDTGNPRRVERGLRISY